MSPLDRWRAVVEMEGLTRSEKAILGCLAFHANSHSMESWPAQPRICRETGYAVKAVREAIRGLKRKGLISIVSRSNGSGSNQYYLDLDEGVHKEPCAESTRCSTTPKGVPQERGGGSPRTPNKERTRKEPETPSALPSIWDLWTSVAGESNRSVLGRLIGDYGEEQTAQAVAVVERKRPADPVSYIRGVLKKQTRRRSHPTGVSL